MITEEDIDKIAKRVLEVQAEKEAKRERGKCSVADITNKYHKQIYDKFGTTGQIENAIRTVAVYKTGVRYMSQIPEDKFETTRKFAEKLYEEILGE